MTTSNQDQDRLETEKFNVVGYLLKPVTLSNFVEMMVALNQYWMLCEVP
ncbi:two-component response regulator [Nostoc sp. NIES-3756]|nr:two-component response regulator [Nostoc sp. NIES-3756]